MGAVDILVVDEVVIMLKCMMHTRSLHLVLMRKVLPIYGENNQHKDCIVIVVIRMIDIMDMAEVEVVAVCFVETGMICKHKDIDIEDDEVLLIRMQKKKKNDNDDDDDDEEEKKDENEDGFKSEKLLNFLLNKCTQDVRECVQRSKHIHKQNEIVNEQNKKLQDAEN